MQNSSNKLLKANHNILPGCRQCRRILCKIRQTNFWKQTTTSANSFPILSSFYAKFVKQTFESKPQLPYLKGIIQKHSMQNSSNKLLKANHNFHIAEYVACYILCKIRQTNFWKQTTTIWTVVLIPVHIVVVCFQKFVWRILHRI